MKELLKKHLIDEYDTKDISFDLADYEHFGLRVYQVTIDGELQDYAVGTDEQADDAFDQVIEDYIEMCIIPELPEVAKTYFDYDKFTNDASYDGRGHWLASYDSNEIELENDFYAYRI